MKIGDYARTLNGKIWIIKSQQAISGHKKDIINSSPNIIDLIEVGDYVNGHKVIRKYEDRVVVYTRDGIIVWFEYQIKSIVTKEQFEGCEFKLC